VSYEDPFSAASAVEWFNGKDFKGARAAPPPASTQMCTAAAHVTGPAAPHLAHPLPVLLMPSTPGS